LLLHLSLSLSLSRSQTQHDSDEVHAHAGSGSGTSANNVREIVDALAAVRFSDIDIAIAPPLEGGHVRCVDVDVDVDVDVEEGEGEGEETYPSPSPGPRPTATTVEDVRALRVKLETLLCESGLNIDLNLEIF
jgi:hypothetical protein